LGHLYDTLMSAADVVTSRLGKAPVGAVLGSGLSECLDNLDRPQVLEFADIPGMPIPSTVGHRGALIYGHQDGVPLLALCGRVHMYEGRPNPELAMGVRLLSVLGVHTLLVTSAVSSLDPSLLPGHIMLVDDHINLSGMNVLAGEHEQRFGPRFTELREAYDPLVSDILTKVGSMAGVPLSRGVLAQFLGPTWETPSEVKMARNLGARVVSMSMVPDVIAARQRGMRVAGLACVTRAASSLDYESEDSGLGAKAMNAANLQLLLSGALPRLAAVRKVSQT
jgi:purine-nucleoside phosphorylase